MADGRGESNKVMARLTLAAPDRVWMRELEEKQTAQIFQNDTQA